MKTTINDKAEIAIGALDGAALEMFRQIKTGRLDRPAANRLIKAAESKARAAHNAYLGRQVTADQLEQLRAFDCSALQDRLTAARRRFDRMRQSYTERTGAVIEVSPPVTKSLVWTLRTAGREFVKPNKNGARVRSWRAAN